jgi:hypothetical protein
MHHIIVNNASSLTFLKTITTEAQPLHTERSREAEWRMGQRKKERSGVGSDTT